MRILVILQLKFIHTLKLYSLLSKISFLKNRYVAKFLFVAFLGIHIPLIGLVFFVVYLEHHLSPVNVFWISLLLTIAATVITLVILKKLMIPVLKGSQALLDYRTNLTIPKLPLDYTDEAGVMLRNIQSTIQSNQKLVADKKEFCKILTTDLRHQALNTELIVNAIYQESTNNEIKNLAKSAIHSVNKQLTFVDAFVNVMEEEDRINIQQVRLRRINLKLIWDEVQLKFKSKLEQKNITIHYTVITSDVRVRVNLKLLEMAFSYLLDNAIKYSPSNSKIDVVIDKFKGRVKIQIKDYGIGFDTHLTDKIFTKFHPENENQLDYSPGIGLYLTRQIIERFGGTITAESKGQDKGADFCIELKLYR